MGRIPPIRRTPTIFFPVVVEDFQPLSPVPGGGGFFRLMVCGGDAVKVRQAAPIYSLSRAELGGAIRSSVNSFLDPVRDTLSVCDFAFGEFPSAQKSPENVLSNVL